MSILRISRSGVSAAMAVSLAMTFIAIATAQPVRAHNWSYHSLDEPVSRVKSYLLDTKDYLSRTYSQLRYSLTGRRGQDGVLVMKLGLGIPYCKGHAATIGVREGNYFRAVARARTLRGVRARNIGLMAVTLEPGTYFIVHGRCHVRGRIYNVGLPVRRIDGRRVDEDIQLFRTSYAKFTIDEASVTNAGFLRFFPLRRGKLKIKLQRVPRGDLRFLARRFPDLYDDLRFRLMQRTNAAGVALNSRRPTRAKKPSPRKKVPLQKARAKAPAKVNTGRPKNYAPPLIRMPKSTPEQAATGDSSTMSPASTDVTGDAKAASLPTRAGPGTATEQDSGSKTATMTDAQRRAACNALLKLKRQGKVPQLPVTCLRFGLRKSGAPARGLPPSTGKDK